MNKRLEAAMKKINYLESELDWQGDVLNEQHMEFDEYWRSWCAENDIEPPNFEKPKPPPPTSEKPVEIEQVEVSEEVMLGRTHFKVTYKKLAMAVHPDKNDGEDEDFKQLNFAWAEGKWSIIINLAIKYDIAIHNSKEIIRLLNKEAKDLEDKRAKNESMFSWKFWECGDDEECKERLIKHFMNTVTIMKKGE